MKTIAISERTFEILRRLREEFNSKTYEETMLNLIAKQKEIPDSLFGSLKGKTKSFDETERRELWIEE